MPNTRSAIKRMRSDEKKRLRNKSCKSKISTFEKKYFQAIEENNSEAKVLLSQCFTQLDRAAKKGIIKKAKADRKKSRLAMKLNKLT